MAITDAKEMLLRATRDRYAVGAFNVSNLLQLQAVLEEAVQRRSPLIIQTSTKPAQFLSAPLVVAAYRTLAEGCPVPVCLHLDHCTDVAFCKRCADAGYTNIMIDASKEPFEANIARTREVVQHCHARGGISVEGELGTIAGVEEQIRVVESESLLCDPQQAVRFVDETGVDLFAPAVGTAHGVYATKDPKIDFDRFGRIAQRINGSTVRVPLVVHGGTGLPDGTVRRLVSLGAAKFNVSTNLKHVLLDTTYEYLSAHREEYDPGKLDKVVKEATRKAIRGWMELLGCAGKG